MVTEFELSYTASEINNKLGQIDQLSQEISEIDQLSQEIDKIKTLLNKTQYSITYNLTNIVSSNTSNEKYYGDTYFTMLNINGSDKEIESILIVMDGNDITNNVYINGIIIIEEVTGNIIITASAKNKEQNQETQEVKNFLIAQKQKLEWTDNTEEIEITGSNGHAVIYSTTPNNCQISNDNGDIIYLIPIPSQMENITIENNSSFEFSCRYQGFTKKSENNKFTRIFDSGQGKGLTYDFVGGQADYIAITLLISGVEYWPNDFDSSLISITFNDLIS